MFGMILAYFLCIAIEYTMVDLLKDEFMSPVWITVKVRVQGFRFIFHGLRDGVLG